MHDADADAEGKGEGDGEADTGPCKYVCMPTHEPDDAALRESCVVGCVYVTRVCVCLCARGWCCVYVCLVCGMGYQLCTHPSLLSLS